jgi:cytochrome d ubiquinol oxidase subunit II
VSGPELYFALMGVGLVAYALTGGADFGGGVWDLLATGPRKADQRRAIEHAIAPIWEANHVWLIFVVVLMFTVFPQAFAALSVALHIPLTLALVGVVLRGAAFTFRAYGLGSGVGAWGRVFAWSSLVTPVFLGVALGATATGAIRVSEGAVRTGFFAGWTTPFALTVGLLALALFALLAAVYLAAETEGEVQEDFRRRALITEVVAGAAAAVAFFSARSDAPDLYAQLAGGPWTVAIQAATAACALSSIGLLWTRRPRLARLTVAAQVALVVLGFGLAMDGHVIRPDLPVAAAGARPEVMAALPPALAVGGALLLPSLWFLFRVFKARDGVSR